MHGSEWNEWDWRQKIIYLLGGFSEPSEQKFVLHLPCSSEQICIFHPQMSTLFWIVQIGWNEVWAADLRALSFQCGVFMTSWCIMLSIKLGQAVLTDVTWCINKLSQVIRLSLSWWVMSQGSARHSDWKQFSFFCHPQTTDLLNLWAMGGNMNKCEDWFVCHIIQPSQSHVLKEQNSFEYINLCAISMGKESQLSQRTITSEKCPHQECGFYRCSSNILAQTLPLANQMNQFTAPAIALAKNNAVASSQSFKQWLSKQQTNWFLTNCNLGILSDDKSHGT